VNSIQDLIKNLRSEGSGASAHARNMACYWLRWFSDLENEEVFDYSNKELLKFISDEAELALKTKDFRNLIKIAQNPIKSYARYLKKLRESE